MAGNVPVRAWELRYRDSSVNSDKFYRLYVIGRLWVAQWGRHGAVGQFKVSDAGTPNNAVNAAEQKGYEKEAKGYHRIGGGQDVRFDIPGIWVPNLGAHVGAMHANFTTASSAVTQRPPGPIVGADDQLTDAELAAEEKFKATLLRMAGELADEPIKPVPTPATVDPNSMEARLAAAMQKAKAQS